MPHDPAKSATAKRCLAAFKGIAKQQKTREMLCLCAEVIHELEESLMKAEAIIAVAEKKIDDQAAIIANIPPQPPADHVLSDAGVAALTGIAAKLGVDVDGNPLPVTPPAA